MTIPFKYNDKITRLKFILDVLSPFDYLCIQLEQGLETGYKHYQCYVEFKNARYWDSVRKLISFAHVEERKGSQKDAFKYCTKEDTRLHGYWEFGTRPVFNENGSKNGLKELFVKAIMSGASDFELLLNFPTIYKKQVVNEYREILGIMDPYLINNRDVIVHYIYGASGTGKSSYVRRTHDIRDLYFVSDYDKDPFGNYKGQKVIVFEEYRQQFSLSQLLQYIDIYPVELPSRYNNKIAKYTEVYIISNWELKHQYQNLSNVDRQAFYRRIKYVYSIDIDYIYRYEIDRNLKVLNKTYVYNPLGNKIKDFPNLPTRFDYYKESE